MKPEELSEYIHNNHGGKYGLMPPPLTDREFTDFIIKHFLDGYYSVNPISREQFNTEALYMILNKTQPKIARGDGKFNYTMKKIKNIFGGKR